jgi:hypothetical protein
MVNICPHVHPYIKYAMVTYSYGSLSRNVRGQYLLDSSSQLSTISNNIVLHSGIMLIRDVILRDLIAFYF